MTLRVEHLLLPSRDEQRVAFAVEDDTFEAILGRVQAGGLEYRADPVHRRRGELNDNDGGRASPCAIPMATTLSS